MPNKTFYYNTLDNVDSSAIEYVAYNTEDMTMLVKFLNGNGYIYSGVSIDEYAGLATAHSVGSYYSTMISGNYGSENLGHFFNVEQVEDVTKAEDVTDNLLGTRGAAKPVTVKEGETVIPPVHTSPEKLERVAGVIQNTLDDVETLSEYRFRVFYRVDENDNYGTSSRDIFNTDVPHALAEFNAGFEAAKSVGIISPNARVTSVVQFFD